MDIARLVGTTHAPARDEPPRPVRWMRRSALLASLAATFACGGGDSLRPASSDPVAPVGIAGILDSIRAASHLPALGGAIVTRDSVWALAVVGTRRIGGSVAATSADRFHLGSNLKAMTSGLAGLLVDRGRLRWDTTLEQTFPELLPLMRPEYRTLTLRELLSQQAGFPRDPGTTFSDATPREQRLSAVRWAVQQPPAAARGTYFYSNLNYIVAGAMLERATNTAFEQLLVEQLLAPLGMTSVGFGAPGTPGLEDQPWQHHLDASGALVAVPPGPTADNPPVYGPAGRAHMSLGDWATWTRTVLRAEADLPSPWARETARVLTTPQVATSGADGYAFGWVVTSRSWATPTGRVLTHNGTNTLSYSVAWLAPDGGFGVLAVTNEGGDEAAKALDGVASRLIALYRTGR